MHRTTLLSLAAGVFLAGCNQQFSDNQQHEQNAYRGLKYQSVAINDQKWILKDNLASQKFILASNLGEMYGDFARETATWTLAKNRGTKLSEFRPAADTYASSKQCKIVSGRLMQRHQAEFEYTC